MERQSPLAYQVDDIMRQIDSLRVLAVKSDSSSAGDYFIPPRALAQKLGRDKIKILLDYERVRTANYDAIHDHYLGVFCTLIRIGKAGLIACFTRDHECSDRYLPFYNNSEWSPQCRDFFEDFKKAQWEFCAQPFRPGQLDDQLLRPSKILPIIGREYLKKGPDSTVERIQVHPDYDYLIDSSALNTQFAHTYVLKTYDSKRKAIYDNEISAYKMLKHPDIAGNLVRMHGSWSQNDTHSILLEFVEGGTLEDLFKGPHPTSPQEKLTFWRNLIRVLETLGRIHKHIHPDDPNGVIEGVHQDIKPANILVSKIGANFPFDYSFKVVDLGLTYFNVGDGQGAKYHKKDGRGTQTYSAPECFRDERDPYDQLSPSEARPSKDIWSLGCVFSLALVWSVLGSEKVKKYQVSLERATMHLTHLRASAYVGCFHDGERMLREVHRMHNEVLMACGRDDFVITEMVGIVTDMLNEVVVDRPGANLVRRKCRLAIQRGDELTTSFPTVFLTQEEITSRPQTPPEVPPDLDCSGLHIELRSQPHPYVAMRPHPAERNTGSPPGCFRRSTHDRDRPHSIDTVISNGSPTSAYGRTSGRLSGQDLGQVYGTPPVFASTAFQPLPNQISRAAMPEKAPNGNGTALTLNGSAPFNHQEESSASPPNAWESDHRQSQIPETHHRVKAEPHATIDEILTAINKKKNGIPSGSLFQDLLSLPSLNDRDQIFLIDNSASMEQHWPQVRRTFEALGYIAKWADPDGIELYFTNWAKGGSAKDRKRLLQLLQGVKLQGQGSMEPALSKILDRCTQKRLTSYLKKKRGVNIYVLTDGIWTGENDSLCGIDDAIERTVKKMNTRNSIGIQFIQFGHNPTGSRRLSMLDDGLKGQDIMDIIDHTHADGNVFKMLLGSIDTYWDGQPADSNAATSPQ